MKARVIADFTDLRHLVLRKKGEVFELDAGRFEEIDEKLPGFIEEVKEEAKRTRKPATRRVAKPKAEKADDE